jgi:hypothetical protein
MNSDLQPSVPNSFPPLEFFKLRKLKFGANPTRPFVSVPPVWRKVSPEGSEFVLRWEDSKQRLSVEVHENDDGRLIADVWSGDAKLLNKGAITVGIVGNAEFAKICKTIPLSIPANDGCSGSTDLGSLADALKELGSEFGMVVFLGYE